MSPPPIEATRWQPSSSAIMVTAASSQICGAAVNQRARMAKAASAPRLSRFLPGSISGLDLIRADSFPNATIDPVKVTAPMNTPMTTSAWWMPRVAVAASARAAAPPGVSSTRRKPFQPTSTAARPTNECSSAISSGIPVIATTRARYSPIAAPTAVAPMSSARPAPWMWRCTARAMVAARATTMPAIPELLPARAVSCRDRPARARMNNRAATMYAARAKTSTLMSSLPDLAAGEHRQHAAGHREAAEDVDAREEDRRGRQRRDPGVALADLQQGTDDDDPGDGVGHRHQRRVQRMVHVPDDVVADHDREREHGQVRLQRRWRQRRQHKEQRGNGAGHCVPPGRRRGLLHR